MSVYPVAADEGHDAGGGAGAEVLLLHGGEEPFGSYDGAAGVGDVGVGGLGDAPLCGRGGGGCGGGSRLGALGGVAVGESEP